jgi:hypothetical protein
MDGHGNGPPQTKFSLTNKKVRNNQMKTTLAFFCMALCCAASVVFADPPPDSTTSMAFKDPTVANCAGGLVGSVGLGPGNDVSIQTTTTTGNPTPIPVTEGKVQLDIATDGMGNPTSVANNQCWVRIDGMGGGVDVDANGQACVPTDLDNLSSLGLDACGFPLQNVTCAMAAVGFRARYIGQGNASNSSVQADLTIDCGECGTESDFTIGISEVEGAGNPCPGSYHCWEYTFTVENCTDSDLSNVKIQGGTSAWLDAAQTVTNDDGFAVTFVNRGRNNRVWTLTKGTFAQGESVHVTAHVCGTVSMHCGEVMYLSGPWSATGTRVSDNIKITTTHTLRAAVTVDCNTETCQPGE